MKKFAALFLLTIYSSFSFACSTFLLSKNGQHVFGRNYDWVTGNGMIVVNAKGLKKSSFIQSGKAASWISKYGSISFNQCGKEFPHGGMNEKGLVVELMWLQGTKYPANDNRAAMNELQWIQYQLDNCSTIDEVLATDKAIRIDRDNAAPLHYLIADANGNAATIEFLGGKMIVHRGKDLSYPVLTNTPYSEALQQTKSKKGGYGDNSLDRFATACNMVQQFQSLNTKQNAVDYAFNILGKVSQRDYTKWSIVYDITGRQIHFTTSEQTGRKSISLKAFDFNCKDNGLYLNLNSPGAGTARNKLSPLNVSTNQKFIEQSAKESRSQINIPPQAIAGTANYFQGIKCQ